MKDMPEMWQIYASTTDSQVMARNPSTQAHPDFRRTQLYIAINHVSSDAKRLVGMPWHKPARRDDDIAELVRFIQHDAVCLSLDSPATK